MNLSFFNNFPHLYKFISFNVHVDTIKRKIDRSTYSLFELFSDVGGLMDFARFTGIFFLTKFSSMKKSAIIAN